MTDLEIYQPSGTIALPPSHDIDSWVTIASDVIKIAKVIYDTPFVPDGLRGSEPAVAAAILAGREMGLGPMTSLQHIHVIKGKPGQSALLMRALIEAQGHKWEDVDVSDTRVVVRGCRKGEAKWTEATFTATQAKLAGIDLGKYPQDKLYARATVRLARRKFADVIMGMPYSAEELEDGIADEGTVTETAASNGHAEPAKPAARTARRARTPASAAPASPPPPADSAPQKPADGPPLPPLPGEDDVPTSGAADTAATAPPNGASSSEPSGATDARVGLIVQHFERLGYTDRDIRLGFTAILAGRDHLDSTKDLTDGEAKTVLDTLARCKNQERLNALVDAATQDRSAEGTQESEASDA